MDCEGEEIGRYLNSMLQLEMLIFRNLRKPPMKIYAHALLLIPLEISPRVWIRLLALIRFNPKTRKRNLS